ncbi:MAG: phosphoenolpyruvate kinase, partial [Ferruginibacter sp.]
MLHFSVDQVDKDTLLNSLGEANLAFQEIYPGDKPDRQAVHTVYGGANLFKSDTTQKIGDVALKNFRENAPDFTVLPRLLKWEGYHEMPTTPEGIMQLESYINSMSVDEKLQHPGGLAKIVYDRIIKKLATEGVEDFRIDFEDGFGNRPDEEEDATAINAATELAEGMKNNTISPFIGIRIKPFTEDLKVRGVRTLDIFLTTLLEKTGGKLPGNFVVMLPKVTIPEQVKTLVRLFEIIEHQHKLPKGS